MHEPPEAQVAFASAWQESLQGRGDRLRPDIVVGSGSDVIAYQEPGRAPSLQHKPSFFHPSRTMDQESLSYWWRFNGTVRFRLEADIDLTHSTYATAAD